jgi:hypothetical protein
VASSETIIALLASTEPGRRNRRTIDAVTLLGAAIVIGRWRSSEPPPRSTTRTLLDALETVLAWADSLWRVAFVGFLGLALAVVLDVVLHRRWSAFGRRTTLAQGPRPLMCDRSEANRVDARGPRGVATMATLGVRSRSLKRSLALRIPLNHAPSANRSEPTRTPVRVDKLGVTGSSPVPPTSEAPEIGGFAFSADNNVEAVLAKCSQRTGPREMACSFVCSVIPASTARTRENRQSRNPKPAQKPLAAPALFFRRGPTLRARMPSRIRSRP